MTTQAKLKTAPETVAALYEALDKARLLLRVDEEPSRSVWRDAHAALRKARGEA
jgi:hypothetical protein